MNRLNKIVYLVLQRYYLYLFCLLAILIAATGLARAQGPLPQDLIQQVGFDQKLNQQIPLDLIFTNSLEQPVRLGHYFEQKPVVLVLSYYECPMLCPMVRNGLVESLKEVSFTVGQEFEVVIVSIDPAETPEIADMKRRATIIEYGRTESEAGWHFLTGHKETIARLAAAIGFRYTYDPNLDQYVHPSGLVILTPQGKIARYFYGIDYPAQDLRLGLVEAAANKIGSPIDQFLLLCYHYDPVSGEYTPVIMNIIRIVGVMTVALIGGMVLVLSRYNKNKGNFSFSSLISNFLRE